MPVTPFRTYLVRALRERRSATDPVVEVRPLAQYDQLIPA